MLFRAVVTVLVAALALALAACAETGEAMAAGYAEQAATIAATQASMATTQAINDLETASTQMSTQAQAGQTLTLPKLPPVGKGRLVIVTKDLVIIQQNGQRTIIRRPRYDDDGADQ
jgi:hypothetical protein